MSRGVQTATFFPSPTTNRYQKAQEHCLWIGAFSMAICYFCWQAVMLVSPEPPFSIHITTLGVMLVLLIGTLRTVRALRENATTRNNNTHSHNHSQLRPSPPPPHVLIGDLLPREGKWDRN